MKQKFLTILGASALLFSLSNLPMEGSSSQASQKNRALSCIKNNDPLGWEKLYCFATFLQAQQLLHNDAPNLLPRNEKDNRYRNQLGVDFNLKATDGYPEIEYKIPDYKIKKNTSSVEKTYTIYKESLTEAQILYISECLSAAEKNNTKANSLDEELSKNGNIQIPNIKFIFSLLDALSKHDQCIEFDDDVSFLVNENRGIKQVRNVNNLKEPIKKNMYPIALSGLILIGLITSGIILFKKGIIQELTPKVKLLLCSVIGSAFFLIYFCYRQIRALSSYKKNLTTMENFYKAFSRWERDACLTSSSVQFCKEQKIDLSTITDSQTWGTKKKYKAVFKAFFTRFKEHGYVGALSDEKTELEELRKLLPPRDEESDSDEETEDTDNDAGVRDYLKTLGLNDD